MKNAFPNYRPEPFYPEVRSGNTTYQATHQVLPWEQTHLAKEELWEHEIAPYTTAGAAYSYKHGHLRQNPEVRIAARGDLGENVCTGLTQALRTFGNYDK